MRVKVFTVIILFFFPVLILGLFYTQIAKHDFYRELSEKNRIRVLALEAPRGKIYDSSGNLLVSSRISFDVEVIFQELIDEEKAVYLLGKTLGVKKEELSKKIKKASERPFVPVKIIKDIEKNKAIAVEEIIRDLPGVIVTTRPLRNYLYGKSFSHVTGYLGKISEEQLNKYKIYGYRMQDFVGKDGVERTYNDYLHGINGGLQTEVDSKGRQVELLAIKEPQPGKDLYLTINLELQKFCDSILEDKKGAIVAMEPSTGAVLALVSHPDFNPNAFVKPNNYKEVIGFLNNSKMFPMLNRAISGTYPSGSVFKIVIAAAALDSGKFNPQKTFICNGQYPVGNRLFHCWNEKGHKSLNIKEAIKYSCNVFFYQLGLFIGPDVIAQYAFKLGFGNLTGIDLPGESKGLVPSPSWKRKMLREAWYRGETANYAIGQGYLLVTPIQVCRLVSAIANGGKLVHPFVVEKIEKINLHHAKAENLNINKKTIKLIKESLKNVVNGPRGTGLYARSKKVTISGKTGTAQNPHGKSHAWFVGFAPFEDPKISVVVFLEQGGKGGLKPARFSKKIIEKAYELNLL